MLMQLLPAIAWTIIMFICIAYVSNNEKFHVVYFDNEVKVEPSPSLVWDVTKNVWRGVGYAFFGLMWIMTILLMLGAFTKFMGEKSKLDLIVVGVPLALSCFCFFATYSSKLVNNYVSLPLSTFNTWLKQGFIKEVSESHFEDKTSPGNLKSLFDNKVWI